MIVNRAIDLSGGDGRVIGMGKSDVCAARTAANPFA